MKNIVCLMILLCVVFVVPAQSKVDIRTDNKVVTKTDNNTENVQPEKAFFFTDVKVLNFGEIAVGRSKTLELKFTNKGKKTLVINSVYTNCGCTTVEYPEEAFASGKSGVIKVTYTPTEEGPFNKTFTINTNGLNASESIRVEGLAVEK